MSGEGETRTFAQKRRKRRDAQWCDTMAHMPCHMPADPRAKAPLPTLAVSASVHATASYDERNPNKGAEATDTVSAYSERRTPFWMHVALHWVPVWVREGRANTSPASAQLLWKISIQREGGRGQGGGYMLCGGQ
eukprot:TRINITY_DN15724_c0_g1_i1.p2 TRINITY_DN15724_c0_g1~~TRINITY_DN15724_c0_g1_i1.p2  ORF type:complete len:135 (-),score=10.40 TRINITY_DN15724_c0_g1_i1:214-618(-)